jgi:hypothetical protein
LVRAAEAVEKAALSPDPASRAGLAEAVTALRGLLSRGAAAERTQRATWADLRAAFLEKGRLVLVESRRLHELGAMMPVEQVVLLVRSIFEVAKEVVEARLEKEVGRPLLRELTDRTLALLPDE